VPDIENERLAFSSVVILIVYFAAFA